MLAARTAQGPRFVGCSELQNLSSPNENWRPHGFKVLESSSVPQSFAQTRKLVVANSNNLAQEPRAAGAAEGTLELQRLRTLWALGPLGLHADLQWFQQ